MGYSRRYTYWEDNTDEEATNNDISEVKKRDIGCDRIGSRYEFMDVFKSYECAYGTDRVHV